MSKSPLRLLENAIRPFSAGVVLVVDGVEVGLVPAAQVDMSNARTRTAWNVPVNSPYGCPHWIVPTLCAVPELSNCTGNEHEKLSVNSSFVRRV